VARVLRLGIAHDKDCDTIAPRHAPSGSCSPDGNGKYKFKLRRYTRLLSRHRNPAATTRCTFNVIGETAKPGWPRVHARTSRTTPSPPRLSTPGDLDGKKLNEWISELLRTKGADIYRMKGVLAVKGTAKRLVFKACICSSDAKFDREWNGSPRTNTLVFIGKNLERAKLTEAFKACLA